MGDQGAVIYHGTPMTPRAALEAVLPGRAGCVSFYRPDDLEALEAICPQLMFRPRRVFLLDGRDARREGMGSGEPGRLVAGLLQVAGAAPVRRRPVGDHPRQPRRSFAGQRRAAERLALWPRTRLTRLAYGRPDRAAGVAMRAVRPGMSRMDRRSEEGACGLRCLPPQDGRRCGHDGQHLAPAAHAARNEGGVRLPLHQRGQHEPCAERPSI